MQPAGYALLGKVLFYTQVNLWSPFIYCVMGNFQQPTTPRTPQHSSSHPPQQSFPPPQHFSPRLLLTFRTSNLLLRELSEISRGDGSLNLSLEMR